MRAPEFVIVESPYSTVDRGKWVVRPLNMERPLLDVGGDPKRPTPTAPKEIHADINETSSGSFVVTTQVGRSVGGRRYRTFGTYQGATECALKWARRRFRVLDGWVEEARRRDTEKPRSRQWAAGRVGDSYTRRWFATEAEATRYVESLSERRQDRQGLLRGDYYVDSPVEEVP